MNLANLKKLREDFPVDWEEDHYVTRREFFKFATLASGGLAVGSTALAAWHLAPKEELRFEPALIANISDLEDGRAREFRFPRPEDLCLLVQPEPGVYKAYSRRCTHLSCPVEWQPENDWLYCPCHNGAFSARDGSVLQGPPPRPLPEILLEVRGDEIYAVGVKRGEA
jgi:nitrite reductase/ring-hydroxylating ferredoxin subunit